LKYLMDVMGLRNLPYWIGNLLVDGLAITILNLIFFGIYAFYYPRATYSAEVLLSPSDFVAILIPHGIAFVTIGYTYSFIFESSLDAVKFFPLLYYFGLFPLSILQMRQASVVLTTHSMYEAESLSHKIGILINGSFVCIGPTQHLKDKYSQGYKVTVSLVQDAPDPMQKVMSIFPSAVRVNEASSILQTYQIPFEGFRFSNAFEKLEELKGNGHIKDFSIYNTTLEQILFYFSKFQISIGNGVNQ